MQKERAGSRELPGSGIESFANLIKIIDCQLVELKVFPFEFLDIKTVEAAVLEEILAQSGIAIDNDLRQEVMQIDGLGLDIDDDIAEELRWNGCTQQPLVMEFLRDFGEERFLLGAAIVQGIELTDPFLDVAEEEIVQVLLRVEIPHRLQQLLHGLAVGNNGGQTVAQGEDLLAAIVADIFVGEDIAEEEGGKEPGGEFFKGAQAAEVRL